MKTMQQQQHQQQTVAGLVRPNSLLTVPSTYQPRQDHSFGTASTDGPWRRGDVIDPGSVPTNAAEHGTSRPPPHYWIRRPARGRNPGWSRGRRRPNYSAHYSGSPVHIANGGAQFRGSFMYRGGMRRLWNASMPQGLQHCGLPSAGTNGYPEDGFIDDTLLNDLSQYSLYETSSDYFDMYDHSDPMHFSQKLRLPSTSSQNTPDTDQKDQTKGPLGQPVNGMIKPDAQYLEGDTTGVVEQPDERGTENMENQDAVEKHSLHVSGGIQSARTPTDYMTLVWDSTLLDDPNPSLEVHSNGLGEND